MYIGYTYLQRHSTLWLGEILKNLGYAPSHRRVAGRPPHDKHELQTHKISRLSGFHTL